jgi:enoyl-CoA hydratase
VRLNVAISDLRQAGERLGGVLHAGKCSPRLAHIGTPLPLYFWVLFSTLLFDVDSDGIGLITVNRPDKLNALNSTVIAELDSLIHAAEDDAAVGGLILTGAGPKAFVAGADITELADIDREHGIEMAKRGARVFRQIEQLNKPVIAAVNGFALGGGCELAMACHIRLASPTARFAQPEVKLGLIPGFGGTVRLPRLVGRGRALELLLTGNMIDAEEAARIGLVNRVVPAATLLDEARALLRVMLAQGPVARRLCLRAVDGALDLTMDDALALEATYFGDACASEDKAEGTRAFLDKRPSVFHGR